MKLVSTWEIMANIGNYYHTLRTPRGARMKIAMISVKRDLDQCQKTPRTIPIKCTLRTPLGGRMKIQCQCQKRRR